MVLDEDKKKWAKERKNNNKKADSDFRRKQIKVC